MQCLSVSANSFSCREVKRVGVVTLSSASRPVLVPTPVSLHRVDVFLFYKLLTLIIRTELISHANLIAYNEMGVYE